MQEDVPSVDQDPNGSSDDDEEQEGNGNDDQDPEGISGPYFPLERDCSWSKAQWQSRQRIYCQSMLEV